MTAPSVEVIEPQPLSLPEMKARAATAVDVTVITSETRLAKAAGPTPKKIQGGNLLRGRAEVVTVASLEDFARLRAKISPTQATTYGRPVADTADIVTELALPSNPGAIMRGRDYFSWPDGPGILMIDVDHIEITASEVIALVRPILGDVDLLWAQSGSSRVLDPFDAPYYKGGGHRVYAIVDRASAIPSVGKALHRHLFVAGHGRFDADKHGKPLERSVVDHLMWAPERLDFGAFAIEALGLYCAPMQWTLHRGASRMIVASEITPPSDDEFEAARIEAMRRFAPDADPVAKLRGIGERVELPYDYMLTLPNGERITADALIQARRGEVQVRIADPMEPEYGDNDWRIAVLNTVSRYIYSHAHGERLYSVALTPPNTDGMEPVITPPASGEAYTADDVCKADDATLKAIAARPEGEALAGAIEQRRAVLAGTAEAVVAWLQRQPVDVVRSQWVAMTLPLVGDSTGSAAEQEIVAAVMRLTGSKKIETRQALRSVQTDAKRAAKEASARAKAAADAERKARRAEGRAAAVGDRTLIWYDPTMPHECAVEAVDALLKKAPPSALVNFSGTVSRIGVAKVRTTINGERTFVEQTSVIQHTRTSLVRLFEGYVVFEEPGSEKTGPVATKLPVAVSEQVVELTTPVDRDRQDVIAPTGIETLEGLVSHPVVLPDGKVLSQPGLTDGFYIHGEAIEGCRPYSRDEASAALVRLRESFGPGVAWASPADLDRGIAMLLTGLMRRGLDQAPAFLVSAAVQSSGKTSLVKWVHALLTGEDLAVTSMAGGGSTEEFGKAVFSDLLRNPATICLDNIPDGARLESSVLAAILTAATYTGRILGASVVVNVRTNVLIAATGNNLSLGRDELSRFLPIRLTEAAPEVKAARARDIVGKARAVRADLLRDAIGILAGVLTERPAIALDSRFPGWDESVRVGILWAGGSDVAAGFAENEDQSGDRTAERVVFEVLVSMFGNGWFLRREMAAAIRSGSHADIIDALTDLNVDPDSDQALGRLLAKMEGRSFVVGERKVTLVRETGTRGGIPRFQMRGAARREAADPFGS